MKQKFKKCLAVLLILACTFSVNLNVFADEKSGGSPEVTVTFVTYEGDQNVPAEQTTTAGSTVTEPKIADREGYTFNGWYNDAEDSITAWDFSNVVNSNITLTAHYTTTQYTVTFDAGVGVTSPDKQVIDSGNTAKDPGAIAKDGYSFDGWYNDAVNSEKAWDFLNDTVSSDTTLTAHFTQNAGKVYKVTFDAAGGSVVTGTQPSLDSQSINEGKKATAPDVAMNGYVFDGWYYTDSNENSVKWNFDDPVQSDLALTAQYTKLTQQDLSEDCGGKTFTVSGMLPEGAFLNVSNIEDVQSLEDSIEKSLGDGNTFKANCAYDVKIIMSDKVTEFQPESVREKVSVSISNVEVADDNGKTTVFHIKDDKTVEQLDTTVTDTNANSTDSVKNVKVGFETTSFSPMVLGESEPTNPEAVSAAAISEPEPKKWAINKSKTATALDSNKQTTVTLSLPSAEYNPDADIVFLLDKSSCGPDTVKAAQPLFKSLQSAMKTSDVKIKVAVVAFDGTSHELYKLTPYDGSNGQIAEITDLLNKNRIPDADHVGGTNMQAGLMMADEIMQEDSSVSNDRKYVIMVSDGLTRLFTVDGQVKDIYYQYTYKDTCGNDQYGYYKNENELLKNADYFGMIDEWDQVRNKRVTGDPSFRVPGGKWDDYLGKITQWVKKDGDTYAMSYEKYGDDATNLKNANTGEITDSDFKYIAHYEYQDHAMAVDRAVYEAYNQYSSMAQKYHCYAVNVGTSEFSAAFMGALNKMSGNSESVKFGSIASEIAYLVGSGTVTDKIGNDFDLMNNGKECPFSLTVAGSPQIATITGENEWSFGSKDTTSNKYPYVVSYLPGSDEQFTWTINVPVENANALQLSYKLLLTTTPTEAGTYTYQTNKSAILNYTSSDNTKTGSEDFEVPSVTYTVPGGDNTQNGTGTSETTTTTTAAAAGAVLGASRQPAAIASTQTTPQGQVLGASRNTAVPKTSDDFPMTLLILMEVVGISGVTAMLLIRKKRNSK